MKTARQDAEGQVVIWGSLRRFASIPCLAQSRRTTALDDKARVQEITKDWEALSKDFLRIKTQANKARDAGKEREARMQAKTEELEAKLGSSESERERLASALSQVQVQVVQLEQALKGEGLQSLVEQTEVLRRDPKGGQQELVLAERAGSGLVDEDARAEMRGRSVVE